jgi:transposase
MSDSLAAGQEAEQMVAIAITRRELTAADLRAVAAKCRDAQAARRMLAVALVLEGVDRTTAAETCGALDRQTLRDWVHRCFPPYSPELNPVENVWQYLRSNWLAISVFEDYDAIVDACCHTCRPRAVSSPACGGGFHLFAEIDPQGRPHAKAKLRPVRTELTRRDLICLGAIVRAGRPGRTRGRFRLQCGMLPIASSGKR